MTDETLQTLLRELLDELAAIGEDHGELWDTLVRERLFDAVHNGYLKPNGKPLRDNLGFYEDDGNRRARAALERYVTAARTRADALGITDPNARLKTFLDSAVTSSGGDTPDEFFGWLDSL